MKLPTILALLFTLGLALTAPAQPAGKSQARVGFIGNADPKTQAKSIEALRQGLRDLGWIEGSNLTIEYRWVEGRVERLPGITAELVRKHMDVIVTAGEPATRALQSATSTIPVVFAVQLFDPVESGFAKSLAHPGGNVTGVASQYEEIIAKHVQLLKDAVPGISRLALLRHRSSRPAYESIAIAAAKELGLRIQVLVAGQEGDLDAAFKSARAGGAQGLLVLPSPYLNAERQAIVKLAATYRLPALYEFGEFVEDGGLMSYGPNIPDMYRRAASYVDRILKGANPGELPIERASRFEFVVNLKTATALGIELPPIILVQATRVLQ